jgi:hypothetical protein
VNLYGQLYVRGKFAGTRLEKCGHIQSLELTLFFHIGVFQQPIIDWDEHVYMYLSEHMA